MVMMAIFKECPGRTNFNHDFFHHAKFMIVTLVMADIFLHKITGVAFLCIPEFQYT